MNMDDSAPLRLRVAHCFQPRWQRRAQRAVRDGKLARLGAWDALAPERLRALAGLSLLLLLGSIAFFFGLNLLVYRLETGATSGSLSASVCGLLLVTNLVAYLLVLALHEAVHGLVFFALGGRPTFGARLPFALYCGAPDQLFSRNAYLAVGLAPFILLSLAGIAFIVLAPAFAPYVQFALIGNASGAAGDLWAARILWQQPSAVLVEDTATGFTIYGLTALDKWQDS
jgi:hypothetical protein